MNEVNMPRSLASAAGMGQDACMAQNTCASEPRKRAVEGTFNIEGTRTGRISSKHVTDWAALEAKARADAHAQIVNDCVNMMHGAAPSFSGGVAVLAKIINAWNHHQGFWTSLNTGEKIALMHSELSEALEADRKKSISDKIEGFTGVEEELADTIIRIFDFAGQHDLRLSEALFAKLEYNFSRPYKHGKEY